MRVQIDVATLEKKASVEYEGNIIITIESRRLSRQFTFNILRPFDKNGCLTIRKGDGTVIEAKGKLEPGQLKALSPDQTKLLPVFALAIDKGITQIREDPVRRDTVVLEPAPTEGGMTYGSDVEYAIDIFNQECSELLCSLCK